MRSGKLISAPDWFTENFPEQLMDGELWMERGTFEKLSGIVRKIQPNHIDWRQVRYMLFELPEHPGTYTRRVLKMVKLTEALNISWLQPIPPIRLNSEDALLNMLDKIVKKGHEGLMLHHDNSISQWKKRQLAETQTVAGCRSNSCRNFTWKKQIQRNDGFITGN